MKTKMTLLLTLAAASFASAGDAARTGGLSPLEIVFIAFGALILLGQFFPAIALFGAMVRGLFSTEERRTDGGEVSGKS